MSKVDSAGKPIVSSAKPNKGVTIGRPVLVVVTIAVLLFGGLVGYFVGRESLKSEARDVLGSIETGETANQTPSNVTNETIDILGIKVTRSADQDKSRKDISEALNKIDQAALDKATFDQLVQVHTIAVAAKDNQLANDIAKELKSRKSDLTSAQQQQVDMLTSEE